jgi:hypothetical protein
VATGIEGLERGRAGDPPADTSGISNPVLILLIWLVGASACLLLFLGSKLTFLLDDWEFLLYRRDFDAEAILHPHGEHIVVAPVLIYKGLLATVGMGSALPFRVVSTALFLLSAVLLFAFLKERVGEWPALAATAVVLFLGAAWEDLLWSFQVGYFGAMAAGLGALLALERESRRGDALACLLLVVAVLFSSLGLPFAIGAAVAVLLRPDRWRGLYVFALPLAVYALWWLGWGHTAESAISLTNVGKTPLYVLDGLGSSISSALGLSNPTVGADRLAWIRPLAVAAIALAVWRLYRLGRTPRWFWVTLAIGSSFWILAGFNQMPGRTPDSSRYQYLGVIFLVLIAAELLRGVRLSRNVTIAVFIVAAAALASNIQNLVNASSDTYHPISQLEKADLGAIEIARDSVEPGFVLSEDIADTGFVHVEAAPYLAAVDAFGSPAYSDAEIAASPDFARFAADKVLFGALAIASAPAPASVAPATAPSAAAADAAGVVSIPAGSCVSVPSDGSNSPLLALPRAGAAVRAGTAPVEGVMLARFATGPFPIVMTEGVAAGATAELAIPPDRSDVPWKMQLDTASPTIVCGLADGGEGA